MRTDNFLIQKKTILNNTYFRSFLGWAGSGWVKSVFFGGGGRGLFENLVSVGFTMAYDIKILNKHPVFVILELDTSFWVGQKVCGAGQFFL